MKETIKCIICGAYMHGNSMKPWTEDYITTLE